MPQPRTAASCQNWTNGPAQFQGQCGFQSHHPSSKPTLLFLESGAWASYVHNLHGGKLRLREAKSLTVSHSKGGASAYLLAAPGPQATALTVSYRSPAHLGPLNRYHPPKATVRTGRQAQDALPSHTGLEKNIKDQGQTGLENRGAGPSLATRCRCGSSEWWPRPSLRRLGSDS